MATNRPCTSSSDSFPVTVSRSRIASTELSPTTSLTSEFHSNSILGLANARSCMIFDARNSSRRCTSVTLVANFVRKIASSIAESPPPTTAMGFSRKKNPSHVAQVRHAVAEQALLGGEARACGPTRRW